MLMMPGPTEVDPRVIRAMMRPAISHGDVRFHDVQDSASAQVAQIIGTVGEVIILVSSGRGGIEAAMSSGFEPGDRIVIVNNGVFGNMLKNIARRCRIEVVEVTGEPGQPLDLDRISDAAAQTGICGIAMVHSETSTGVLNPIREVGEIARRHSLVYIVDAVSSAGGAEILMDEWGIDFLCTGSQKCIGSLAGLAMVGVSGRMWDFFAQREEPIQSNYFDISHWKRMWFPEERGGDLIFSYRRQPMTMATHLVYALEEACRMVLEEGLDNRIARHERAGRAIRASLPHLGLRLFPAESEASPTTTAILPPEGIDEGRIRGFIKKNHGILAAGGLESYFRKMLRIGHMSLTASPAYILPTIAAVEHAMLSLGIDIDQRSAVEAAQAVFNE